MPLSSMIESRLYRAARMIVFLTAVWVTGFVGSARADIFEPVSFTLDNGMRVVVVGRPSRAGGHADGLLRCWQRR